MRILKINYANGEKYMGQFDKINENIKGTSVFDKLSKEEQEKIVTNAPKWWNGINLELKKIIAETTFKGSNPESLTKTQIEGLFMLATNPTQSILPIDVRYSSEYYEYMKKNGWNESIK
ncbi:MAG: hypothetical protein WC662_03140 [Candidatus Paceibacterota bacterium]|jgi:hypothetical protein